MKIQKATTKTKALSNGHMNRKIMDANSKRTFDFFLSKLHPSNKKYLEDNNSLIKNDDKKIEYDIMDLEKLIEEDVTKNKELVEILKFAYNDMEVQEYLLGMSFINPKNNSREDFLKATLLEIEDWLNDQFSDEDDIAILKSEGSECKEIKCKLGRASTDN